MARRTLRDVLSENLKWLMSHHKGHIDSTPAIAARAKARGRPVSQRTVHRAVTGTNDQGKPYFTNTESLDGIAAAFELEPWQLLHPDLPTLYGQRALSLQEKEKVHEIRKQIAALSEPAQAELFGSSPAVKEIMQADPYPSEKLEAKGWSAAGKAVSRRDG